MTGGKLTVRIPHFHFPSLQVTQFIDNLFRYRLELSHLHFEN
jgi:hypothetical protein